MKQTKTMKASEIWKTTQEALNDCDNFDITLTIVDTMKANVQGVLDNLKTLDTITYDVVSEYRSFNTISVASSIESVEREAGRILATVTAFEERADALLDETNYLDRFEMEVDIDEETGKPELEDGIPECWEAICGDLQSRDLTPHDLPIEQYYELCTSIDSLFNDIIEIIYRVHSTEEEILERAGIEVESGYLRNDLRKGLENIIDIDRDLLPDDTSSDNYCYYDTFN